MEQLPTPTPGRRAPLVVEGPRPCIRCAYDLAGLGLDAFCPECAAPVRDSHKGDMLLHRDPKHLARLWRGALIVEFALVANFLTVVVLLAAVLTSPRVSDAGGFILWVAFTGTSCLGLCGWWLASTPDPGRREEQNRDTTRLVLRWALVIEATAMLLACVSAIPAIAPAPRPIILVLVDTPLRPNTLALVAFWALAGLVFLAAAVRHGASLLLVRGLALRMPDPSLASNARATLRLALGVMFVGLPGIYISSGTMLGSLLLIVVSLACLAWFVLHMFLVERFRARIGEIGSAARSAPPA